MASNGGADVLEQGGYRGFVDERERARVQINSPAADVERRRADLCQLIASNRRSGIETPGRVSVHGLPLVGRWRGGVAVPAHAVEPVLHSRPHVGVCGCCDEAGGGKNRDE